MKTVKKKRPSALPDLVAGAFTICLFGVSTMLDVDEPAWVTALGLGCFAFAVLFAGLPFLHLARYGKPKPGDAFFETTQVADKGVYGLVRHPQYLGYMLLVVGFASINPHPLTLGLAGAAVAFFYLQCVVEERFCLERMGTAYGEYKKRVPRINVVLGLYRIVRR